MNKIGSRIRMLRKARKLSQAELAKELGYVRDYLCMIERGKRIPSLRLIERARDFFDCSYNFLLGLEEEDQRKHDKRVIISLDKLSSGEIELVIRKGVSDD